MDTLDADFVSKKDITEYDTFNEDESTKHNLENQKCADIFLFDGKQFIFSCYFCSILFTEYEIFTNHILEEHAIVYSSAASEEESDYETKIEISPVEDVYKEESIENEEFLTTKVPRSLESNTASASCDLCTKSFRTTLGLSRHRRQIHNIKTESTGTKKRLKKYKCDDCETTFYSVHHLKVHERIHTGELPFQCETCKKCFRTKHQLEKHIYTHTNSRPYSCSYCQSAFNHPKNLTVHIRRIHLDERRYKCDLCEKTFVTSSERVIHMRQHTDERPYQCDECGYKFRIAAQLTIHKRVRHNEERNFGCKECGKRFKTKKILKSHMITHSDAKPFSCKTCDATFARKRALITHEKLHSDIKEYVCKICGKEFAQNPGLYSHMKTHKINSE